MIPTLQSGHLLRGTYRVVRYVARGGMAELYQVEEVDKPINKWALKMFAPTSGNQDDLDEARQLFDQEAALMAKLDHPNIPKVVERFDEDAQSYLVMEFVEGKTLLQHLEAAQAPLPEIPVLRWAVQLCEVLDYLHNQPTPIIYRDLKPENIILSTSGIIKLLDFGIARTFKKHKKKDTISMGTEVYAPLEQFGHGQTDARSDVYALGATMYHLLTNALPPLAVESSPLPPRAVHPFLNEEVDQVIMGATERLPQDRYQSAQEMEAALTTCLVNLGASPSVVRQPPPPIWASCPACSFNNRAEARFCGQCGISLSGELHAVLQVWQAGVVVHSCPIDKGSVIIGRPIPKDNFVPELDLTAYDTKFVSRRHARIEKQGDRFTITDLKSANRTFVNKVPLRPGVPEVLHNADQIFIGRVKLEFRLNP